MPSISSTIPPPDDTPKTNALSYLFPNAEQASDNGLWIDPENPHESVSAAELLQWVKRVGVGFDGLGFKEGEVFLVYSPNHIFLPVIHLAIVATGRVFSGVNPAYTASGIFGA